MSGALDRTRKILYLLHGELKEALQASPGKHNDGSRVKYTGDTVLRIVVCHIIKGSSLPEIITRNVHIAYLDSQHDDCQLARIGELARRFG